jgi:hypothetical protein
MNMCHKWTWVAQIVLRRCTNKMWLLKFGFRKMDLSIFLSDNRWDAFENQVIFSFLRIKYDVQRQRRSYRSTCCIRTIYEHQFEVWVEPRALLCSINASCEIEMTETNLGRPCRKSPPFLTHWVFFLILKARKRSAGLTYALL